MANQLTGKALLQDGVFSESEQSALIQFIEGTMHRREFTDFVMHCYNHHSYPEAGLAPLLRYVDIFQLEGLMIFMRYYSYGSGVHRILSDEYFASIKNMKVYS